MAGVQVWRDMSEVGQVAWDWCCEVEWPDIFIDTSFDSTM